MTSTRHYTDEELERYAFEPTSFAGKADVETHLTGCRNCRQRLEVLEGIEDALRQKIPWLIGDDMRSEPPTVPSGLQAFAAAIDGERARARAVLEPLLASPLRFRNADLINNATFHSAGAVAVLCQAARDLTERQPQFALLVANVAVAIASNLTASKKVQSTLSLGRAFLERGRTLFVIGRYKDAEDALARAERAYDSSPSGTGWDLASVWLIQANVCVESERPAKARLLAIAAARQFRLFGDVTMYLNARLLLASVLFMERDYRASAEAAEEIVQQTRARGDTLLLARALQNCGEAHLMLQEYERALPYYLEAYEIWDELGLEVERIRTNWSLATVDIETGRMEAGIKRLDDTYRQFEALGITNDAALTRMQLAEAFLRVNRTEPVASLLDGVVVNFAAEGMMRNARIALAYLQAAIEQGRLNESVIRHVRTYIEQLPFQPHARFLPPR